MNEEETPVVVELLDDSEQEPADTVSPNWLDPNVPAYPIRREIGNRTKAPFAIV